MRDLCRLPLERQADREAPVGFAPDQAVAYTSIATGRPELWLAEPGQPPRALTSDDASEWGPRFTPDGRRLVFHALRGATSVLSRIDRDGTNRIVLAETTPRFTSCCPT